MIKNEILEYLKDGGKRYSEILKHVSNGGRRWDAGKKLIKSMVDSGEIVKTKISENWFLYTVPNQKTRTIEDVKNSVARNAGLRDWSEVYTKILPTQIDVLVNSAINWSIELYKSQNQKQ